QSLSAGDPRIGNPVLGALIGSAAADRIEALVADAVAKGASLLTPLQRDGTVLKAIVLDHVTAEMRVYGEESFGPIAPIVRVRSADEAVRVASDTDYGLAAAVFGRDIARTLQVARRMECGVCHINGATVNSEPQLPFGGTKASGHGRFGGKAAIHEFTDLRLITVQTEPQSFPL
ncbi:MAG: aldehyde dehydrogenase family protein, partial [Polaromonas sp.]